MAIANDKKAKWLEKTKDPAALELLENSLKKSADLSSAMLYKEKKEDETMNENKTEVTEQPVNENAEQVESLEKSEVTSENNENVEVTENKDTTEAVDEKVADEEVRVTKAEDIVTMLEPLIQTIEAMGERVAKLEKALTETPKDNKINLLPSAATATLLKERLAKSSVNTFLVEADEKLEKSKPAEETVKTEEKEVNNWAAGFATGI